MICSAQSAVPAPLTRAPAPPPQRERRLAEREAALSSGAFAGGRREKNWPVCCKVVHHDIKGDVPARAQRAVTLVYWSFLLFAVCMAYNTLAATCALFTVGVGVLWQWMLSWIFIIGGVPGAAILWYLRLYNAATNDRFTTFIWFFLMYFIHLVRGLGLGLPMKVEHICA